MNTALHQRSFVAAFVGLIAVAWLALWLWAESPYGRYIDHGDWTQIGIAASICAAVPAGNAVFPALLYAGGWLLMLIAMMLPTTLPLLVIYRRLTRRRRDAHLLLALVISGYLIAWLGFGLAAHAVDGAVHGLVEGSPWLTLNGWAVGAAVLALAGAFQFTRLKYRCLDRCRMPLGLIMEHWPGRHDRWQALRLGWRHGVFCVGCCWALMLLMFIVGIGNVGWMLVLGALMAVEKNLPWGRRLSAPLGVTLLASASAIVYFNVLPSSI